MLLLSRSTGRSKASWGLRSARWVRMAVATGNLPRIHKQLLTSHPRSLRQPDFENCSLSDAGLPWLCVAERRLLLDVRLPFGFVAATFTKMEWPMLTRLHPRLAPAFPGSSLSLMHSRHLAFKWLLLLLCLHKTHYPPSPT